MVGSHHIMPPNPMVANSGAKLQQKNELSKK